jgi:protein TonB
MQWATVERWRTVFWATVTLLALVVAFVLLRDLFQQNTAAPVPRPVTTITQVQLPPPPPPPPPPKEKPRPIQQLQPKEQTPQMQKPSAKAPPSKAPRAPPGNPLTARAGPGSNQYGLAVGNGGGDTVGGGGGGGDPFGYYDGVVAARIRELLQKDDTTRYGTWAGTITVWLDHAGHVQRVSIDASTGDARRDSAIIASLVGSSIGAPAPDGYPTSREIRIGARAPG